VAGLTFYDNYARILMFDERERKNMPNAETNMGSDLPADLQEYFRSHPGDRAAISMAIDLGQAGIDASKNSVGPGDSQYSIGATAAQAALNSGAAIAPSSGSVSGTRPAPEMTDPAQVIAGIPDENGDVLMADGSRKHRNG
jgi:hypothetical protein